MLLILSAALLPSLPAGAPPSLAEDLLRAAPGDAVVVITARDLDGLRARSESHAWTSFLNDPSMAQTCAALEAKGISWQAFLEKSELPVDPLDVLASIHDSATFFVAPFGAELEPSFGVLIAPGEEREAFDAHFDALLGLLQSELTKSSATHGEVALTVYRNPSEGDEPDLACFEVGGMVALVGSTGPIEEVAAGVIDRFAAGAEAGAATASNLADARTSAGGAKSLEFFLDVGALLRLIGANESDEDFVQFQAAMDMVGISKMRWLYANADLGKGEELDLNLSAHIPEESYVAQFVDFLGPLPTDLGRLLPANSTSFLLANYDIYGAWKAALAIVEKQAPEVYKKIQDGLQMAGAGMGLDIEQDLIAQIAGTLASFTVPVPEEEAATALAGMQAFGIEAQGFDQGNATIIGLADPDVVELFVEDALDQIGIYAQVATEEFQGTTVNSFVMPGMGGFHWSFTADGLVLSEYPTALRATLSMLGHEQAPESALQVERFQARTSGHAGASMLGVNDTAETLRMALAVGGIIKQMGSMVPEAPDLSDLPLPSPDIAKKHFKGTLLSSVDRSQGALVWSLSGR